MSGRHWKTEAAGLLCTIEVSSTGDWVVTLASISVSRDASLVKAIVRAAGGLVSVSEAEAIAAPIVRSRRALSARSAKVG